MDEKGTRFPDLAVEEINIGLSRNKHPFHWSFHQPANKRPSHLLQHWKLQKETVLSLVACSEVRFCAGNMKRPMRVYCLFLELLLSFSACGPFRLYEVSFSTGNDYEATNEISVYSWSLYCLFLSVDPFACMKYASLPAIIMKRPMRVLFIPGASGVYFCLWIRSLV